MLHSGFVENKLKLIVCCLDGICCRRTMEIIEEQKYRFALYDSQKGTAMVHVHQGAIAPPRTVVLYKSNARVQEVQAPPKSLATSYSSPQVWGNNIVWKMFCFAEDNGGQSRNANLPSTRSNRCTSGRCNSNANKGHECQNKWERQTIEHKRSEGSLA